MSLELESSSFPTGGAIPRDYTGEGADQSPELHWRGTPPGAQSLALVVDDPDAPAGDWVHWVLYDLPASASGLPEAVQGEQLPSGTKLGKNDWRLATWQGPKPPSGEHHYHFKLYALDTRLGDLGQPTKAQLEQAMRGHVLEEAELVGTYRKGS